MAMMYAERAPSRQITGAAAVIGVHAALIFAIVTGLAVRPPINPPPPPVDVVDVPVVKPVPPVPVVPRPIVITNTGPIDVPKPLDVPDLVFPDEVIVGPPVGQTFYVPTINTSASTQPLPLRSDPRHPLAPPVYPAAAIRGNQEGIVRLLIYVLPDGRVAEVKVERSSGFPLLDSAAVRKARAAWSFLPATSGSGQAIAAWGTYDVKFELKLN